MEQISLGRVPDRALFTSLRSAVYRLTKMPGESQDIGTVHNRLLEEELTQWRYLPKLGRNVSSKRVIVQIKDFCISTSIPKQIFAMRMIEKRTMKMKANRTYGGLQDYQVQLEWVRQTRCHSIEEMLPGRTVQGRCMSFDTLSFKAKSTTSPILTHFREKPYFCRYPSCHSTLLYLQTTQPRDSTDLSWDRPWYRIFT
jgi:hypothetical protein